MGLSTGTPEYQFIIWINYNFANVAHWLRWIIIELAIEFRNWQYNSSMAYYIIIRMEDYYIDEQEYLDDPIEKHSPELTKESTMGSDYPTFETLTREINLL